MMLGRFKKKTTTNETTLVQILRGLSAGRLQSVGYMQVIPLLGDLSDDRFVSPVESRAEIWTRGYGSLSFRNPSNAILIVPCHAGYVVKEAAQDHAMAQSGLVESGRQRSFDTAMCIQQTQGGLIRRGEYQMLILPFALRERALEVRHERGYGKLWDAIAAFNKTVGISGPSHLDGFLRRFRKELDEFVAEFECLPNQLGAIILVDGQVVGIERAPSHAYWRSVWPCLIRECYGSLAIQVGRSKGETPPVPSTRFPLPEDVGSLDDLADAIAEVAAEEERRTKQIVRELLDKPFTTTVEETVEEVALETLSQRDFVGQVVRDGDRVVYASVLATRERLLQRHWETATPFSI